MVCFKKKCIWLISHNRFSGTFNLTDYSQETDSQSLQYMFVTDNQLSDVDFSGFPNSLRYFYGGSNLFNGTLDGSTFVNGIEQVYLGMFFVVFTFYSSFPSTFLNHLFV